MELSDQHREYLNAHAVPDEIIDAHGIVSDGDEIHFPWKDGDRYTIQRRPWPGESGLYFWETGKDLHFWMLNDAGPQSPAVLTEGTKQCLAAAAYAPEGFTVLGMAGCWGWSKEKLGRFKGREVYLCLDADAASNLDVYDAGEKLGEKLKRYGVKLKYVRIPGSGSQGLDDYLASFEEDERADMLAYEIEHAGTKPAERRPTTRKRKMESDLPDTGGRPGVAVNRDRQEVIGKITDGFKERWDGTVLFNYGDLLTRVRGHETLPLDKETFYDMLADTVACYRYSEATDKRPAVFDPAWPDQQSMDAVRSKASEFSPLDRVVRIPFLRPDGSVCSAPGYDRSTSTVLVSSGIDDVRVPESPTQDESRMAAKFLMEEWLGDLSFKEDADRANALAFVLTPFIRGTVPLAPMAVVSGLQMGVGKNLFADCVSLLATGQVAEPLPYIASEEEMRKQITASFAGGNELFVFDEAHSVEGAQLARAVTSLKYTDRVLGVSRMAKFPNLVTWAALGNQVQVNGDMSRRVYFIYLHPSGRNVMDREESEFRHPDLKGWTSENRAELVTAALTVLRGWHAAGKPAFSRGATMGSFEPWDRMMSGALAHAGFPTFLTDMKTRRSESDFTASYWQAHVHWLRDQFGGAEFTTAQVRERALRDLAAFEAPPGMEDTSGKDYTRQLGMAYARHRGRDYEGVRLVKSGMGHKSTIKWRIDTDNGGTEVEGGGPTTPPVAGGPSSEGSCEHVPPYRKGGGPASTSLRTSIALGFDIETASAGQMWTGGHAGPFVRLCGLVEDNEGGAWGDGTAIGPSARSLVDSLNRAETIYGHNILGFDLLALARHCGADYDALAAKSIDTLVLERLADPPMAREMPKGYYGLDAVAQRLGHTGKSDDLTRLAEQHGGYDRIPVGDPEYRSYLHGDLAATQHVYAAQTREPLNDYARREMKVVALQNRMTLNGWMADTELLAERVAHEDAQRAGAVAELAERYGMPVEKVSYKLKPKAAWPGSLRNMPVAGMREALLKDTKQAVRTGVAVEKREPYAAPWATAAGREALVAAFRAAGAEHYPKTPTGALALSSDALGDGFWVDDTQKKRPGMLNAKAYGGNPEVRRICELLGQATGATAKYAEISKFVTADGRVHGGIGADQASGRWAMTRPSLTNLGKRDGKVVQRAVFLPEPGHVLLAADMDQVDMRGIAGHCQDPAYMALFEPGRDVHSEIARAVFGRSDAEWRERAKRCGHGWNYGMSVNGLVNSGVDRDVAEEFDRSMQGRYPRLCEWRGEVRELAASGALLDNGFGRLMRPDPGRAHTQGPALMGQGAARDLMTTGLLRLPDSFRPLLRGVVHDEVVVSVPEADWQDYAEELRRAFTFEWRGVPLTCGASKPGADWAACYS